MRRRIMWRLIWVCAVCLCPNYRTLSLNGLNNRASYLRDDFAALRANSEVSLNSTDD